VQVTPRAGRSPAHSPAASRSHGTPVAASQAAPQPDPGPHVPGASPLRSPSAAPPDADVFSRLQQQQERREERRRLLVDRAMAAAAETCTFSPAISAKGRRSGGRATPLLRDIDRHESDYAASLAEAKEAAPVVVSERQGEALAAYLRRARQAAALRHQRLAVPRADGTGFTSRPVHVGAPASPDGPRPHGSPGQRRPPHRSPGQRRPSPAQGSAAVGKAHGRFAGDVAQALRRARPADPPAAPRSPDRVAALHELRAVERYVLGPHGVQAEAPAAAPAPAVTEPAAPAPFDLPAVARALALSAGVPVVPVPVLRGSPARAARGAAAPSQPGAGPSPAGPAGTGSPLPQTYRLSQTGPARWVPAEPREPARDEASGAAAAASGAPSDAVPASVMLRRARQVEGRAAAAARAEKARRDTMEGRLPVQAGESMEALHARMQALRAELAAEKAAASSPSRTSRGPGVGAPAAGAPASMEPVGVAPRADAGPSRVLYSVSDLTHRSPSSRVPLAEPQTLIEAIQHHAASRRTEAQWRSVQEHIERHARLRPESPAAERRA